LFRSGLVLTFGLACGCVHSASTVDAPMISADVAARATLSAAPSGEPAPRARAPLADAPFDRGDRLGGHYVCAQGRTELTLVIEDLQGNDVSAIFEFDYPGGGGNHTPASGSFRMHGAFDARTRALRLDGDRWIEQPDGYVMVGLVGTVSKSGTIDGTVKGPGCSTFYLDAPAARRRSATR
jgi:hypothetical protein